MKIPDIYEWYCTCECVIRGMPEHGHTSAAADDAAAAAAAAHVRANYKCCIINTSYQKLPFGSGDYPDKLLYHQALN